MRITAAICLLLLGLDYAMRGYLANIICVCGSCGFFFRPWSLLVIGVALLDLCAVWWLRKGSHKLGRARDVATLTLLFTTFGAVRYVEAIYRANDYFDLFLFIPLLLSVAAWLSTTRLLSRLSADASSGSEPNPG